LKEVVTMRSPVFPGLIFLTVCKVALGQPAMPAYGTSDTHFLTLDAWAFEPVDNRTITSRTSPSSRTRWVVSTTAPFNYSWLEGAVQLPTGALIVGIQMSVCDNSATENALAQLSFSEDPPEFPVLIAQVSTENFTGCGRPTSAQVAHTVNNFAGSYHVSVTLPVGVSGVSLQSVRVLYRLQVSPAPATATFTDVPTTHPFFRFIEALAASGVTAGCGGGNYCPNAPITRGEMAVFLSAALGLHFPN
jgi:hypothetical protein